MPCVQWHRWEKRSARLNISTFCRHIMLCPRPSTRMPPPGECPLPAACQADVAVARQQQRSGETQSRRINRANKRGAAIHCITRARPPSIRAGAIYERLSPNPSRPSGACPRRKQHRSPPRAAEMKAHEEMAPPPLPDTAVSTKNANVVPVLQLSARHASSRREP
jgi:hypothetical protein